MYCRVAGGQATLRHGKIQCECSSLVIYIGVGVVFCHDSILALAARPCMRFWYGYCFLSFSGWWGRGRERCNLLFLLLQGVGFPLDIVVCSALGADMYDCVYPTRTARFGTALVPEVSLLDAWETYLEVILSQQQLLEGILCRVFSSWSMHQWQLIFAPWMRLAHVWYVYNLVLFCETWLSKMKECDLIALWRSANGIQELICIV